MTKLDIRKEAMQRQGTTITAAGRSIRILGTQQNANFEQGKEGLVHFGVDEQTGLEYRVKCFWEPTDERHRRSRRLVGRQLPNLSKRVADPLGGAPFALAEGLGHATPFAVVMKGVRGFSWTSLRDHAEADASYPPRNWPAIQVRATWAYGVATAIKILEAKGFVHADMSPGNVVVMPTGDGAGDMALVDFDAYVDVANGETKSALSGFEGFAAPEISTERRGVVGTDRVGMAILIQEFLTLGDADASKRDAFGWAYDQQKEIVSRTADPHPLFAKKHPGLAELLVATLRARDPVQRPSPDVWREQLLALYEGRAAAPAVRAAPAVTSPPVTTAPIATAAGEAVRDVVVESETVQDPRSRVAFGNDAITLDLAATRFAIRANLERLPGGAVQLVIHDGAEVRVRMPGNPRWQVYRERQTVAVRPGLVLFDAKGKLTARIQGRT